jgi:hypothetical protein
MKDTEIEDDMRGRKEKMKERERETKEEKKVKFDRKETKFEKEDLGKRQKAQDSKDFSIEESESFNEFADTESIVK